jgi:hypothetical protein
VEVICCRGVGGSGEGKQSCRESGDGEKAFHTDSSWHFGGRFTASAAELQPTQLVCQTRKPAIHEGSANVRVVHMMTGRLH